MLFMLILCSTGFILFQKNITWKKYLGISLSKLYKLTCTKEIPFFKPCGKMNYFEREEIEAWALRNRIATNAEIKDKAQSLVRR